MSTMRIPQLAERTGDSPTALCFYGRAGLLPAGRTPAGYRVYGEGAVDRPAFIWTTSRTAPDRAAPSAAFSIQPSPSQGPEGWR